MDTHPPLEHLKVINETNKLALPKSNKIQIKYQYCTMAWLSESNIKLDLRDSCQYFLRHSNIKL